MLRMSTWGVSRFIEPCLPSRADRPPAGPDWIHEIKHDGFRIMARRDGAGVRLITRHGSDFTARFPLAAAAVAALPAHSLLIDGEAIVTNDKGLAVDHITTLGPSPTITDVYRDCMASRGYLAAKGN